MEDSIQEILDDKTEINPEFTQYYEEGIISLSLDYPEFFGTIARFLKPDMFARGECQIVVALILNYYEKYNTVPTRRLVRELAYEQVSVDDNFEPILALIERESDHREIPFLKEKMLSWARKKAFSMIYSPEAIQCFEDGDYDALEKIVDEAHKITDVGEGGMFLLENVDLLFEESANLHVTTGFKQLDKCLNDGGPSPKEVVCYLAPTNVGKSIVLCQTAIHSLEAASVDGTIGQNVLFVSFELDIKKTAARMLSSMSQVPISQIKNHKERCVNKVDTVKNYFKKDVAIYEYAPDEHSVDTIYTLIDNLKRTKSFKPDIVILDYMDLMVSRHKAYNKDDYVRQKHVATEIRALAKNTNTVVFTATQTNRAGATDSAENIDMTKAADSFAKQFALDYVISLNQSYQDRVATPPRLRMFIAKNRNGERNKTIDCEILYDLMRVKESL